MPTIHDVARLAGVSIKTVSNAINDYPYMRPATKQKVIDAIAELGYRPNLTARNLRSGRSGLLSLIIPDLRNAYFAELADSVMRAADAQGLSVIIEQSGGEKDRELALLHSDRAQLADGILYSAAGLREDEAHLLTSVSTPIVLLGEHILHGPTDHVTMQNVEGARAATEHLISLGRTRILALGARAGQTDGSAGLRLTGYMQALDEAQLPFDPALVVDIVGWYRFTGADAMRRILASGIKFDAMVAFNDAIALGAMRVMQEFGIRVPDDVAVVGYDDIDEAQYSLPTLSSINPGRDEIATVAIRYLTERIASEVPLAPRDHLSQFELIVRESSR
ncbi:MULTISPECIES: LacI family DNA-binding transcriptional regulator [Subtercola]|uniref:LacI family DNA-binding transcriptional regulator n=1 Tax=Subtercola TaxID=120212 RepID=UPI001F25274E|nr:MULTISPECIES: LacI family DNA-binding transcriptional regulator [Subtercola]MEA9985044.1 LacI family DNA-binding transcriptional regulator [Subtercola sp. RTI3]